MNIKSDITKTCGDTPLVYLQTKELHLLFDPIRSLTGLLNRLILLEDLDYLSI